jgi:hypothetical protein
VHSYLIGHARPGLSMREKVFFVYILACRIGGTL